MPTPRSGSPRRGNKELISRKMEARARLVRHGRPLNSRRSLGAVAVAAALALALVLGGAVVSVGLAVALALALVLALAAGLGLGRGGGGLALGRRRGSVATRCRGYRLTSSLRRIG